MNEHEYIVTYRKVKKLQIDDWFAFGGFMYRVVGSSKAVHPDYRVIECALDGQINDINTTIVIHKNNMLETYNQK